MTRPFLPPKPEVEKRRSSVGLRPEVWDRVEKIADSAGYTRDEVIEHFLSWACEEWEKDQPVEKKKAK